jgi:golgi-specific brefeldin A-resistance guanine nucleotide exchange factor 1
VRADFDDILAQNLLIFSQIPDPTHPTLAKTMETIANAVTHARFVGTDSSSDAIVLLKIVQVMRTLVLSPEGRYLTNENVCEIILSGFRLCFEPRLNGR